MIEKIKITKITLKAARVNKKKKGQNKMLEEQSKNYKLALKQIKSLMNQVVTQLPAEEQKRVDKDIYCDSYSYGSHFSWNPNDLTNPNNLSHDDFKCLNEVSIYMYYKDGYHDVAVCLFILPDKALIAQAWNHDELTAKAIFKGDLHALLDALPSESLEKIISQ